MQKQHRGMRLTAYWISGAVIMPSAAFCAVHKPWYLVALILAIGAAVQATALLCIDKCLKVE